ncbi:MAG: hypothetical protein R6V02_05340 [Candidatus Aminicenantes bacterium]
MQNKKAIEKIIKEKEQRRKELSELSFKKKVHILVELQKMAEGVTKHDKTEKRIIWQI